MIPLSLEQVAIDLWSSYCRCVPFVQFRTDYSLYHTCIKIHRRMSIPAVNLFHLIILTKILSRLVLLKFIY